jgi:eukaryotic-like serine/threonine-protein kinase
LTKPLQAQLQEALGPGYRIERELGGGGMSRVFVAEDLSLAREVVVKVLASELSAGVSSERFRREIQVAAKLQHPHIVPLFSAGQRGELLYFTMPYVEGQSLRAKLSSSGEFTIPEVVNVVRDVASALAYAHKQGVVHRDIKPENVLLSGSHAVVTDFGVSKALSEAVNHSVLTSAGLALGTPAYMAPEQAAADPATDHRADLYALGILAYELLAGAPPFSTRSPAQMLAAQMAEQPEPISRRRSATPAPLAQLVMRLLEKRPADRPQSAEEVLRELDTISTPAATGPVAMSVVSNSSELRGAGIHAKPWLLSAAAVVLIAVVGVVALKMRNGAAPSLDPNMLIIAPFRVAGADPSLAYLREGMVDLLAAKFTGEGGPSAADPRTVMSAWTRRANSGQGDLSEADAVQVAERLGGGRLLLGGIVGTSKHFVLTASVLQVPSGRVSARATAEGPPDSLASVVERLAVSLLAGEASGESDLAKLMNTPMSALKAYLGGRAAYRRGDYETALQDFGRALEVDSSFAHAALAFAVAANWGGTDQQRERGVRLAWEGRSRLSSKDRAYLELFAGPRYPILATPSELIAAGARAVTIASDNPEVWYEYGDVIYHLGPVIGMSGTFASAADAFQRAIDLDPDFAAPREHLIDIAARDGDTARVRRLAAPYLARSDKFGTAEYTRWRVAISLGDQDELGRVRSSFPQMDGQSLARIIGFAQLDGVAPADVALAMRALHRRALASELNRRNSFFPLYSATLNQGKPADAIRLMGELHPFKNEDDSLDALIYAAMHEGGDTSLAGAAASRLGALPRAEGKPFNPGLLFDVSEWKVSRGDTAFARAAVQRFLKEAHKVASPSDSAGYAAFAILLDGWTDFVENRGNAAKGMVRLDSLMRVSPVLGHEGADGQFDVGNLVVAKWLEAKGDYEGALTAIRRRQYHWSRAFGIAECLREEGRLSALAGDASGALRAYDHYLILRQAPEPSVKPQVDSVRAEVARLRRLTRT